jgi:hypothetical protein
MRGAVTGAVLVGVLATTACGCGTSGDCTEKATCADPGDGSTGVDAPIGADGGQAGDAGKDGGPGADGSPSDATPSPDSPGSCGGVCTDAVPAGWSGPVTLFEQSGTPAPTAPSCPSSFPTDAYDGNADLTAPAPTCSCACNPGTGAQCGSSSVEFYSDSLCLIACLAGSYALPPALCVTTGCSSNPGSYVLAAPSVSFAGSCTPQPTSSIPPSTWGTTARACGTTPTTGGCSGGALCVASPPAPFGKVCVSQPGMAACPAGAYSVAHVFYGGVSDSRSCSGCSCGTPTGTSCTGAQVDAFSMNTGACGGTETPLAFGSCATVGVPILGEQETTAPTADNGTCSPSGGQPSGSGVPATPTTLCCTP